MELEMSRFEQFMRTRFAFVIHDARIGIVTLWVEMVFYYLVLGRYLDIPFSRPLSLKACSGVAVAHNCASSYSQ